MEAWMIWILIGILFIIVEIFDPAFFFISLGIGALLTGLILISGFAVDAVWLQIIIFAIISFIAFLFMRKVARKFYNSPQTETNVFALKGKTGHVTKTIASEGKGYVKIGGEEWSAVAEDGSAIEEGEKIIVIGLDGNKVIVGKN